MSPTRPARTRVRPLPWRAMAAALWLWTAGASPAQDGVQQVGRLYTRTGPVDGAVPVEFRIFTEEAGPFVTYWQTGMLQVVNGHYAAMLGDDPYPGYSFQMGLWRAGDDPWLEGQVDGQVLSPRQRILSVPYALNLRGLEVDAAGNVGLGTPEPQARLHLADANTNAPSRAFLRLQTVVPPLPGFWGDTSLQLVTPYVHWNLRMDSIHGAQLPHGALGLRSVHHGLDGMVWTTNGFVGVGVIEPGVALDVAGDLAVSGDYLLAITAVHTVFHGAYEFRVGASNTWFNSPVTNNPTFVLPQQGSRHSLDSAPWSGVCAVDLPVGARVLEMRVYYINRDSTGTPFHLAAELRGGTSETGIDLPPLAYVEHSCSSPSDSIRYVSMTGIDEDAYVPPPGQGLPDRFHLRVAFRSDSHLSNAALQGFYGVMLRYTCDRMVR